MRSTRSTWYCLPGDSLCRWCGVSPRVGCLRSWPFPKPDAPCFSAALILDLSGRALRCLRMGQSGDDSVGFECGRNRARPASYAERLMGPQRFRGFIPSFPKLSSELAYALADDCRPHGCLGRICRPARRHLGSLAPRADRWFRSNDGLCYRAAHPSSLCGHLRDLQQAPHVSQPVCCFRQAARCASAPSLWPTKVCLHLHGRCCPFQGCWNYVEFYFCSQSCAHLPAGPLRVRFGSAAKHMAS